MSNTPTPALELTTETFRAAVLESDRPVLVDFHASWCPPCQAQHPIVDALASELHEAAVIAKVDVDAEPALAQLMQVRSIPTLIVFKAGKIAKRFKGLTSRQALLEALQT